MTSPHKLLVVAIDFGTTYSGYAFSFRHEYMSNKSKAHTYLWQRGMAREVSAKAPTSILFDSNETFHSFGYEAEDAYTSMTNAQQRTCYYFKRFKMTLFANKSLSNTTKIKDVSGREMNAMTVFSAGIRYLRGHFFQFLQERVSLDTGIVGDSEIQWVLTVPAIWNDAAKQFMRYSAQNAGIPGDCLTLALEPEAAALYCNANEQPRTDGHPRRTGQQFMIVDCGGGTVDVTVHRIHMSGKLQEVIAPSGGPWGGIKVDDAFQAFLMKVFGIDAIRQMSKNEILQIEREFEIAKMHSSGSAMVNIRVPYCLIENLNHYQAVKYAVQITGDKMRFPHNTLMNFFNDPVRKIVKHVEDIMAKPGVESTKEIDLVGGFSNSKPLQTAMRMAFPDKKVFIPTNGESAVLQGAVMFGHDTRAIGWRVSQLTYGVDIVTPFIHTKHPVQKKTVIEGEEYCRDMFSVFVREGELIENGKATPYQTYQPIRSGQTGMSITVVTGITQDPSYTTDYGCQTLGTVTVRMPDTSGEKNRRVDVRMTFGGTEIKVEALDGNSGMAYSATFDLFQ